MSGIFNVTELAGHRALVTGDANQQCILDTTERDELRFILENREVDEIFNEDIEDFFAPLTRAAELHDRRHKTIAQRFNQDDDPVFNFVLKAGVEGVEAVEEERVVLSHDSVVLRLIDSGQTDRLVWVGNDTIEVIAWPEPVVFDEVDIDDLPAEFKDALRDAFTKMAASLDEDETMEQAPLDFEEGESTDEPEEPAGKVAPAEPDETAVPAEDDNR